MSDHLTLPTRAPSHADIHFGGCTPPRTPVTAKKKAPTPSKVAQKPGMQAVLAYKDLTGEAELALATPPKETKLIKAALEKASAILKMDLGLLMVQEQAKLQSTQRTLSHELEKRNKLHADLSSADFSGAVWTTKLTSLKECLEKAVQQERKVPLLIDESEGDILVDYFDLSLANVMPRGAITVDAKGLTVKMAFKQLSAEDVQEACRKSLMSSIIAGCPLHIALRNSAPDLTGIFFSPTKFPAETLTLKQYVGFDGTDSEAEYTSSAVNSPESCKELATDAEHLQIDLSRAEGRLAGMYPVVSTSLKFKDFEKTLRAPGKSGRGMFPPLDGFQIIRVQYP